MVTDFVEKPQTPASNLAFSGVLIATPEFLNALPNQQPADIGFDVLPRLVGQMSACEVVGYLQDIGTLRDYEHAQVSWPGL
jgi:NDP-sugar pyrophosphorylase family protein